MSRIIIVITRLVAKRNGADDEFVEHWKQSGADDHKEWSFGVHCLFLWHGCWERFHNDEKRAISLLNDEQEVRQVSNTISREVIGTKNLKTFDRLGVLIHPPLKTTEELIQTLREEIFGFKPSFVFATGGHAGIQKVNNKVDEIIAVVLKAQSLSQTIFEGWWDFFTGFVKGKQLQILKHRIAHLFLPVDVDLQGLMRAGFHQNYWKNDVKPYNSGFEIQMFEKTRGWCYGTKTGQDTVEKVVKEARIEETDAWKAVQELVPEDDGDSRAFRTFQNAREILRDLGKRNELSTVRGKCGDGPSNPFHDWFVQMLDALDQLREEVDRVEQQSKRGQT